jgi:CheY-like chemotaxis protein
MCNPNPDILVVEDNPVQMFLFEKLAKNIGFNATITEDPSKAISMASERDFCLILMDWRLPGMTGGECARRIRQIEREKHKLHVPIICTSALAFDSDREKSIEAGMNDFLAKPFTIEQLRATIKLWLHKAPA